LYKCIHSIDVHAGIASTGFNPGGGLAGDALAADGYDSVRLFSVQVATEGDEFATSTVDVVVSLVEGASNVPNPKSRFVSSLTSFSQCLLV
jgi:hypothetical protein